MNYLIFRTDRIGDFLITSPLIRAIKRNDKSSKIFIVASNKNAEFIKKYDLVDEVFLLKSKKIFDTINLFLVSAVIIATIATNSFLKLKNS